MRRVLSSGYNSFYPKDRNLVVCTVFLERIERISDYQILCAENMTSGSHNNHSNSLLSPISFLTVFYCIIVKETLLLIANLYSQQYRENHNIDYSYTSQIRSSYIQS